MSSFSSPNDLLQCVSNNSFYHHYKSKINSENVPITIASLISYHSQSYHSSILNFPPSCIHITSPSPQNHNRHFLTLSPCAALHQPPQRSNKLGHPKQTIQRSAKNGLRPPRGNASTRIENRSKWSESTAIGRG
jgi:hypothetical protein